MFIIFQCSACIGDGWFHGTGKFQSACLRVMRDMNGNQTSVSFSFLFSISSISKQSTCRSVCPSTQSQLSLRKVISPIGLRFSFCDFHVSSSENPNLSGHKNRLTALLKLPSPVRLVCVRRRNPLILSDRLRRRGKGRKVCSNALCRLKSVASSSPRIDSLQ